MKVLVTGGGGFIGSHLCEQLLADGHDVWVLDDFSTGDPENLSHLASSDRLTVVDGDVLDHPTVSELMARCDTVYHMAAAVGVRLIMGRPVETLVTNVRGTEIVLDLASKHDLKVFLASTSEVYGKTLETNGHIGALSEEHDCTLGATSRRRWAYACSKAMDEFLALAYHQKHGLEVVVGRFFNTVGPRQTGRYGMVIPRFVKRALLGETIQVYGDGAQSRSFTHVNDATRAIRRLMETDEAVGEVFNIGNGSEITILELARKIKSMTKSPSPIECVPYEEVYDDGFEDMMRRTPDISRLEDTIGFEPKFDLDAILEDVIEYVQRTVPEAAAYGQPLKKVAVR